MIPKKFTIGAIDFKVKHGDFISEGNLGHTKILSSEILVRSTYDGKSICKQQQEQTFHHELVHAILMVMNEHDLNQNEPFVDLMGQFFYQYLKTRKF